MKTWFIGMPCHYCGMPATSEDHVVPRAIIKTYESIADPELLASLKRHRTLVVPACGECNSVAGATIQKTLEDRKRFIKAKLRKRHRKVLNMPDWSDEEIAELGPELQQHIRANQELKNVIKRRLAW